MYVYLLIGSMIDDCIACSLMPDKTMSLPMSGRMAPLSPDSLSPHEHISYHGTGEMCGGEDERTMSKKEVILYWLTCSYTYIMVHVVFLERPSFLGEARFSLCMHSRVYV